MANEPQREIEKELLAYKQRRSEQAGAPLELHPATRRMLQGEVARTASRPLLSSEEAAKNFVRSFVMSHQQPGFFARHQHRLIWGGAMFACLAVVFAVLRNDPRQQEQARAFSDTLPAPPAVPAPVAARPEVEREHLARAVKMTPGPEARGGSSPVPAASVDRPMLANPLPAASALATRVSVPRETERRSDAAARPLPALAAATTANARAVGAPVSALARNRSLSEAKSAGGTTLAADKFVRDTRAAGTPAPLVEALEFKAAPSVALAPMVLKQREAAQDPLPGISLASTAAPPANLPGVPLAAQLAATTSPAASTRQLAQSLSPLGGVGGAGPAQQRFQQLDDRAQYRQNFNSPPVPQVMQQFAFERIGDRVRIVDGDGSTYEGSVLPEAAESATKAKVLAAADQRERPDQLLRKAQLQLADSAETYRFVASGLNRKLNQSVEFRGQWQSSATPPLGAAPVALSTNPLSGRLAMQTAVKQEKAAASTYGTAAGPAAAQTQGLPQGRISGRAVVGGKNEFDINAVPQ